jgi:hypothetical protein
VLQLARNVRNGVAMSVSRSQIEVELEAAERALEEAKQRRQAAAKVLWSDVSRSSKDIAAAAHATEARRELADADEQRLAAESLVSDLRMRLQLAREREERLQAITDMLIARDQAKRADSAHSLQASPNGRRPGDRRSFLDRFRRH